MSPLPWPPGRSNRYRTRTTKFGRAGRLSSAGVVLIGTANAKRQGQGSSWHLGDYRYRYSRRLAARSVGSLPLLSLSPLFVFGPNCLCETARRNCRTRDRALQALRRRRVHNNARDHDDKLASTRSIPSQRTRDHLFAADWKAANAASTCAVASWRSVRADRAAPTACKQACDGSERWPARDRRQPISGA